MAGTELALLGPLRVRRDGRELAVAGRHARALLAFLAIQPNRLVTRDALVAALWTTPPPTAPKIVYITVSQLRKALGHGLLVHEQRGYRLAVDPDDIDVERFTRLARDGRRAFAAGRPVQAAAAFEAALALWRGDAFVGLDDEPFVAQERLRLEELRLVTIEDYAAALIALDRHAEVVAELDGLAREHPRRERLTAHLMLALYRSGRQADALALYRETRTRLVEDLGIEPGPELRRLERAVLAHDPALEAEIEAAPGGGNIPMPSGPVFGRERELAELKELLTAAGGGLVTLTGPGGVGKTRLALEAARLSAPLFPEGVVFVPLETISEPDLVLPVVARALGPLGRDVASTHPPQAKRQLLVLDSLEHLLAAAPALADLIATSPRTLFLATSRERLRISAEHEFPVPPLALPPERETDLEELGSAPSVALFVERSRRLDSGFVLTPGNAEVVSEICRRVEGLPLSIELAAARTRLLTPSVLLKRLARRLDVLTAGAPDVPARHRTLRATIDWSVDLLHESDNSLLAELSVFAGGWTLEAAEAVCAPGGDSLLDRLSSLIDKSLIRREAGEDLRFGMLDSIRDYALERLAAGGEEVEVRRRHALWYRDLAERAEAALAGPEQGAWLDRLEREHPNLRAAVTFALEQRDGETALRLGAALRRYLDLRGHATEGRAWLDSALDLGKEADPLLRLRALGGAGVLAGEEGDFGSARSLLEQSVALARRVGADDRLASELANLAHVAVFQGDRGSARAFYEEAAVLQRRVGNHRNLALTLENLGCLALLQDDVARARELLEEAHAVGRMTGDPQVLAAALTSLARAFIAAGSIDRARPRLRESLALVTEIGWVQGTAECLELFALVDARDRRAPARSAVLLGAADSLRMGVGAGRPEYDRPAYDEAAELARSRLSHKRYEDNWERGRRLPLSDVVALCSGADKNNTRLST